MRSRAWRLRPAAIADLGAIWRFGATTWDGDQADRYADGLFAVFGLLADFPDLAQERRDFTPPVRIHPVGTHLIVYRLEPQGLEIIRIQHARQDLTDILQD